jgi:hypothetical protein
MRGAYCVLAMLSVNSQLDYGKHEHKWTDGTPKGCQVSLRKVVAQQTKKTLIFKVHFILHAGGT